MKRIGGLWSDICDTSNIKLAYLKARKGKTIKRDVLTFRTNLDKNLEDIRKELIAGAPLFGDYSSFTVTDPKPRTIFAPSFRERVIHHAIINITEPYFDRYLIDQTYACRKDKGTHRALLQAFHYTKGSKYFCKMDVRKYFDSIDHDVLKVLLRRRFKDRELLSAFDRIIGSYETAPGKGVPIGNLTSQHFANFYLNPLDRFCKEDLGCRRYVRYMDDFVLWENELESVKEKRDAVAAFLAGTLNLSLKLADVDTVDRGVPFLGFLIKPWGIYLLHQSKRRFKANVKKKYYELANGVIDDSRFAASLTAMVEHTRMARSFHFRKKIFHNYEGSIRGTGV